MDSGFEGFEAELEDFEVKRIKKFDRVFKIGEGGSFVFTMMHEGVIYATCGDHHVYAIEAKSGKEVWRFTTGDDIQINRQITISGGRLYFGGLDNYLYCLDVRTGKEIWRFRTGKYGNVSSPSIYKNRLYHPCRDGIVYALTLEGKEIWRFQVGGFVAKVMVKDDVVYFGSEDSYFYAVDAATGEEIWRFKAGGDIYDEAKITGNLVCFGCHDCNYYALDMKTRKEVWRFQSSNQQPSTAPSIQDEYRLEIKKTLHIEDAISEEKYASNAGETVSLSNYQVESEYHMESEYKQKSGYNTQFVMFEGVLEGKELWISDSKVLRPQTSKWS